MSRSDRAARETHLTNTFALLSLAAAMWAALSLGGASVSTCYAQGKKCGCPVTSGERILIECQSTVDTNSCGACSVITTDNKRSGRPCISIP